MSRHRHSSVFAGAILALSAGLAAPVHAATEAVIYNFTGYYTATPDGSLPYSNLVDVNGTLYGTTTEGGQGCSCGIVFGVTTAGQETLNFPFNNNTADGYDPFGGLLNADGKLWGLTPSGGASNSGTLYTITAAGAFKNVHSFKGYPTDGADGTVNLIRVVTTTITTTDATPRTNTPTITAYYGVTGEGGTYGYGTAFKVSPGGRETVLHSFGGTGDGIGPNGCLVNVNGTLYGITFNGGTYSYGTVYSITPKGQEAVIYNFAGNALDTNDGAGPYGCLVNVNGTLYGTTSGGGTGAYGTVYAITTAGKESVLHSFNASTDGSGAVAGLTLYRGKLYGVNYYNGTNSGGTAFSITTAGKFAVLHAFGGTNDGSHPAGPLLAVGDVLYGTTVHGGTYNDGTIYSLTP